MNRNRIRNNDLRIFIIEQKILYKLGLLEQEKINLLNRIPNWRWEYSPEEWGMYYQQLINITHQNI